MLIQWLRQLYRPHYLVAIGHTPWGPGIDVHRRFLGMRFRVGDDTFARVASAYIDTQPSAFAQAHTLSQRLAGGGQVRPPVGVAPLAPGRASVICPARTLSRPARRQLVPLAQVQFSPAPSAAVREAVGAPHVSFTPQSSAVWQARCDAMALPGTWAETAEVQAAAHLYDAKIRVFTADGEGNLAARFVGNPGANAGRALDLVLEHGHYRWVEGGIASDSLPREALAAQLRDVPADGNCFFWCVSSGLPAPMREHLDARRDVVDFLRRHEHMLLDGADDSLTLGLA